MRTRAVAGGLKLTELGLGAAQFGNLYREVAEEDVRATFETAWTGGIRYFDTAPHYGLGLSERRLGALLREHPRDDYMLSTKVGRLLVPHPEGAGALDDQGFVVPATTRRQWDFSADGIRRSLDDSLERLGLDRIDIVYVHDPDDHFTEAVEQAIPALIALREQGVIGAVGVGMNQSAMPAEIARRCDIDLVMLAGRYTLLEQPALDDLMPVAMEHDVKIVAAGVYNSGLLATARPRAGSNYDYGAAPAELVTRATRIAEVCERHGCSLPDAAIAFVLAHPSVSSAVLGAHSGAQASSNLDRYAATADWDGLWADLTAEGLLRAAPTQGTP